MRKKNVATVEELAQRLAALEERVSLQSLQKQIDDALARIAALEAK